MRPLVLVTRPFKPAQPSAIQPVAGTASVTFSFRDRSKNETGFVVQRATDAAFTNPVRFQLGPSNGSAADMHGYINRVVTFTDDTVTLGNTYYYRVRALNQSGKGLWAQAPPLAVN